MTCHALSPRPYDPMGIKQIDRLHNLSVIDSANRIAVPEPT